jgi:AraC-like DNA-binding protein
MYREYPPPEALAGFVECFWRTEFSEPGSDATGVVLPDGRVDVIWVEGGPALVAGPQRRSLPRPLRPPFIAIGARFRPGIGPPLLGLPAHELVDMHVPLASIDSVPAAALNRRLETLSDPDQVPRALSAALLELTDRLELDPLVQGAAVLLDRPGATVGRVSREIALSERQLERRFRDSVGYGPKALQRILRFRRFVAALGDAAEDDGLARIATASGYADQAHLTRESRELAGLSPAELGRLWAG